MRKRVFHGREHPTFLLDLDDLICDEVQVVCGSYGKGLEDGVGMLSAKGTQRLCKTR